MLKKRFFVFLNSCIHPKCLFSIRWFGTAPTKLAAEWHFVPTTYTSTAAITTERMLSVCLSIYPSEKCNIIIQITNLCHSGNFRTWPPYKEGPTCASCPNNCENKLCSKSQTWPQSHTEGYLYYKTILLYCFVSVLVPAEPCNLINHFLNCPALKAIFGCKNKIVYKWCPAVCRCKNKIIPIAWRGGTTSL